jgi:NitT/TauT family transport system substrate-binding protein
MQRTSSSNGRRLKQLTSSLILLGVLTACGSDGDETDSTNSVAVSSVVVPETSTESSEPSVATEPLTTTGAPVTEPSATEAPAATDATQDGPATGLDPQPLDEATTITLNVPATVTSFSEIYVAQALGEFEKENLTVEFVASPTPDILPLLAQGDIELAAVPLNAAALNAIDQLGMKLIAPLVAGPGENREGLWVQNDFADGAPASLSGTTIGTGTPGSNQLLTIGDYLGSGGVSLTDVTFQTFSSADIGIALDNGAVSAAIVNFPYWPTLEQSGTATFVAPSAGLSGTSGILAAPSFIADQPEVAQAFVRAIARAAAALDSDYLANDAVVAALSDALGVTPDELRATPPSDFDAKLGVDEEAPIRLQEYMLELGDLLNYEAPLPFEQLWDTSFIERAVGTPT